MLQIRDLVVTNKALRADWVERETALLTLVRDTVAKSNGMNSLSVFFID